MVVDIAREGLCQPNVGMVDQEGPPVGFDEHCSTAGFQDMVSLCYRSDGIRQMLQNSIGVHRVERLRGHP